MRIACAGQGARQEPQPVQRESSSSGSGKPPARGRKRIAPLSQRSPQTRHSTPWRTMQESPMPALIDHGGVASLRNKASAVQRWVQSPQNVHSPKPKSITGKSPRRPTMMPVGQLVAQSPQRVHALTNASSASAQGGRSTAGCDENRPRRKLRRLPGSVMVIMLAQRACAEK